MAGYVQTGGAQPPRQLSQATTGDVLDYFYQEGLTGGFDFVRLYGWTVDWKLLSLQYSTGVSITLVLGMPAVTSAASRERELSMRLQP